MELQDVRSGSDLRIGLEFTVTVKTTIAASLIADFQQILQELGLSDSVRVD
jgi:ADP-dependent phosphofructokinase/glucokinase